MFSFNRVTVIGNLTKDVRFETLRNGTPVANFTIAINEYYRDSYTKEQKKTTCFIDVKAWDKQAEFANQYLKKGVPVFIDGALKLASWEDENGNSRSKNYIRVTSFRFLGQRDNQSNQSNYRDKPESGNPDKDEQQALFPEQFHNFMDPE